MLMHDIIHINTDIRVSSQPVRHTSCSLYYLTIGVYRKNNGNDVPVRSRPTRSLFCTDEE